MNLKKTLECELKKSTKLGHANCQYQMRGMEGQEADCKAKQ